MINEKIRATALAATILFGSIGGAMAQADTTAGQTAATDVQTNEEGGFDLGWLGLLGLLGLAGLSRRKDTTVRHSTTGTMSGTGTGTTGTTRL